MDRATDKALVERLLAGEERAFEEFFEAYFPRLYRFALARLDHNPDSAEEVVQATLTKVIVKLHTFRGEAALFSWLCTFCRHQISAFYRQRKRVPRSVDLMEEEPEILAALESLTVAAETDPVEQLRRKELARLVQVTLDHLPPRYGDALEMEVHTRNDGQRDRGTPRGRSQGRRVVAHPGTAGGFGTASVSSGAVWQREGWRSAGPYRDTT